MRGDCFPAVAVLWAVRAHRYDYHRYHAPVSGTIVHFSECEGPAAKKYADTWSHSVKPMVLHNAHFNILNENRRRVLVIQTASGMRVALLFVGAVQVDSITFDDRVRVGNTVTCGQDMGSFHFGGSTVVMFTSANDVVFDADILARSRKQEEVQVRCGERIGSLAGPGRGGAA